MSGTATRYVHHSRPSINRGDVDAVVAQLESGQLAAGPARAGFEAELATRLRAAPGRTLATASGTFALYAALTIVGVGPGDRVAVPTYACRALADATAALGAAPVVVDVGADYAIAPEAVRAAEGEGPVAAVVVVHPFGRLVPLEPFADGRWRVIEDCAQTLPPGGDRAADASVFSFHATKVLASGEGGAVVARSEAAATALAGARIQRPGAVLPMVVPMSDLAAALARRQLARIDLLLDERRALADLYDRLLPESLDRLRFGPDEAPFRYVVRLNRPFDELRAGMDAADVAIRRPVDPLLHQELGLPADWFPAAESLFARTVSLPLYPGLAHEDVERVAESLTRLAGLEG